VVAGMTHRPGMVAVASAAVPRSLSRQVRDIRGGKTMFIGIFLVAQLGALHFRSKMVVDFG